MTNLERYNKIFCDVLKVEESELPSLAFRSNENWDSVGFMALVTAIEDAFDIELDPGDMMDFTSYSNGKEILSKSYGISF